MLVLQKSPLNRQCIYSNVAVRAQENLCLFFRIVPDSLHRLVDVVSVANSLPFQMDDDFPKAV